MAACLHGRDAFEMIEEEKSIFQFTLALKCLFNKRITALRLPSPEKSSLSSPSSRTCRSKDSTWISPSFSRLLPLSVLSWWYSTPCFWSPWPGSSAWCITGFSWSWRSWRWWCCACSKAAVTPFCRFVLSFSWIGARRIPARRSPSSLLSALKQVTLGPTNYFLIYHHFIIRVLFRFLFLFCFVLLNLWRVLKTLYWI